MAADIYFDDPSSSRAPLHVLGLDCALIKTGTIDCDNSYQTGGYDTSKISGQFRRCLNIGFFPRGGYYPEYDKDNDTMIVRNSAGEVANATDLSSLTGIPFVAWGL